ESKGKKSSVAGSLTKAEEAEKTEAGFDYKNVDKIVFACDAGMGSSATGAGMLKKQVKKAGRDIEVTNSAMNQHKGDEDIIITQKTLTERAENKVPTAKHISVHNCLHSPAYDELLEDLQDEQGTVQTEEAVESGPADFDYSKVDKVVFSCDAGMGSS